MTQGPGTRVRYHAHAMLRHGRNLLFNALTLMSLLLCLTVAALWANSGPVPDDYWFSAGSNWVVGVCPGRRASYLYQVSGWPYRLSWGLTRGQRTSPVASPFLIFPPNTVGTQRYGFGFWAARGADPAFRQRLLIIPTWALFAATAAAPLAWSARRVIALRRRLRDRRHGLCLACGYDLTGNVSGVCPECGTPAREREQLMTKPQ